MHKLLLTLFAIFALNTFSSFGQDGLFGVAGVKMQQDNNKRFSLKQDDVKSLGLYVGAGKEFNLLTWLSVSPIATVTCSRMTNDGYMPKAKNSLSLDFQVIAPVSFKIPLKNEDRYFYIGAGPSITLAALDDRSDIKHFYSGIAFRLGADISDKLYFGADANFGLNSRIKYADVFTSYISVGIAWKF